MRANRLFSPLPSESSFRSGKQSISSSPKKSKRNRKKIFPHTATMKHFPKFLAVLLLSTCCLFGAAACEKTSSAPESEHIRQRTEERAEDEDAGPEIPVPPSADVPERPDGHPDAPKHTRREKRRACEPDREDENNGDSDGENGGKQPRKTEDFPEFAPRNGNFRSRKRLPVMPVPTPNPEPRSGR